MMRRFPLLILCAGIATFSNEVRGQTLKPRPNVAAPKPFTAPKVIERTYGNGMRVALIPFTATSTARIELVIRAGTADESADQPTVAQMVGQLLLEGTRSLSADSIARLVSDLGAVGGSVSINTSSNETTLGVDVLPDGAPRMIELLADLVRHPSFSQPAFDRAKSNTIRGIQSQRSQADWLGSSRTNSLLFPRNPLDRVPGENEIQSLTLASIARFHRDYYAPNRSRLYVAGTFDRANVERAATQAFAPWERSSTRPFVLPKNSPRAENAASDRPIIHIIDRPGATQARVQVSFPVVDQPHPDHRVLNEINMLMGSAQTARIVANIRERHGYSYNIHTSLVRRPGSTQWIVVGDITNNVVAPALREILGEISRLRAEAPPLEELKGFQSFMAGILISENSTARGILESLKWMDLYGVSATYFGRIIPDLYAVTPGNIKQIAARYLTPARMVVVIVGDRKAIAQQLEEIGPVVE
ncbi:MAG TPA: pitrilysin family protein [Gemmatimonadaceae bacterium]|nr:pitrilysin family protein [Gemmatimonadaceae bacterium]